MTELVLAVPANGICLRVFAHGFHRSDVARSDWLGGARYILRELAERDSSWKQVIPYVVVVRDGKVFTYQRTPKGGESRLHSKWSVGVGGHVNPVDGLATDPLAAVLACAKREVAEEIGVDGIGLRVVGTVFDDSDDVGKVHLGVVVLAEFPVDREVTVLEDALADGKFEPFDRLLDGRVFENWSRHVIQGIGRFI